MQPARTSTMASGGNSCSAVTARRMTPMEFKSDQSLRPSVDFADDDQPFAAVLFHGERSRARGRKWRLACSTVSSMSCG